MNMVGFPKAVHFEGKKFLFPHDVEEESTFYALHCFAPIELNVDS